MNNSKKLQCQAEKPCPAIASLIHVMKLHRKCTELAVKSMNLDIPGQYHRLLVFLSHSKKKISQKDIANHMEVSAPAIAGFLKELENKGYIKRTVDENDTRRNVVDITGKGMDVLKKTGETFDNIDNLMLKGISKSEMQIFERCIEKMKNNLTEAMEGKENT